MKRCLKLKEWAEKKSTQMALNVFIVVWIVTISVVVGILLERNGTLSRILGVSTQVEPTVSLTNAPTPTDSPTPFPTYPPVKTYVDPDPIISCNYKYLGTQQIRRSLCNIQFECQIGDKWYFYTSHDKCSQDQKANYDKVYKETYDATYKSLTGNSGHPTLAPFPTLPSLGDTLIDCDVGGQMLGKMTYSQCNQKMIDHFNSYTLPDTTVPTPDTSARDYNNAVSACLNRMRAAGILNSSAAQQCYTNPSLGL